MRVSNPLIKLHPVAIFMMFCLSMPSALAQDEKKAFCESEGAQNCYQAPKEQSAYKRAIWENMPMYEQEPADNSGKEFTKCGYREYVVEQEWEGKGYGKPFVNNAMTNFGDSVVMEPCKIPKKKNLFAKELKLLVKTLNSNKDLKPKPGDVVTALDTRWNIKRNEATGIIESRHVWFRHYSKKFQFKATACGGSDDTLACEQSGSRTIKAVNVARYRLNQALGFKKENLKVACQVGAWSVTSTTRWAKKNYTESVEAGNWRKDLKYKTRYDGVLPEKEIIDLVDKLDKEASALFQECGGDPAMLPNHHTDFAIQEGYRT